VQNNNSKKSDNSKSGAFKNLLSEYDSNNSIYTHFHHKTLLVHAIAGSVNVFPSSPHLSPEQPPEVV
jgi:hypothetical protein